MSLILLVRHGQASVGAADYDVLSQLGRRQAELLGKVREREVRPALVVSGTMSRQRDTAAIAAEAAGWDLPPELDDGWNEFDHSSVLGAHRTGVRVAPASGGEPARSDPLDDAIPRWSSGAHDEDYVESFAMFTGRVDAAFQRLVARTGSGDTAVAVTSAGVIAWIAATLVDGGEAQWRALNRVGVNSAVTRLVVGRRGTTLVTYNEYPHLSRAPVTYR